MRCEPCCGTGYSALGKDFMICEECQGLGIVYCCDEAGANPPNTYDSPEAEPQPRTVPPHSKTCNGTCQSCPCGKTDQQSG